jgi:hypothetical protein
MSYACEAFVFFVDEPFTEILYCGISFENDLLLVAASTCMFIVMVETFDTAFIAVCLVIFTLAAARLSHDKIGYVLLKPAVPFDAVATSSTC